MPERCKLPRSGIKPFGDWTSLSAWPQTAGPSVRAQDGCGLHGRPAWLIGYVSPAETQGCFTLGGELSVTPSITTPVLKRVREASIELDDEPKPPVADVAVDRATATSSVLQRCRLTAIADTDWESVCAFHVATPPVLQRRGHPVPAGLEHLPQESSVTQSRATPSGRFQPFRRGEPALTGSRDPTDQVVDAIGSIGQVEDDLLDAQTSRALRRMPSKLQPSVTVDPHARPRHDAPMTGHVDVDHARGLIDQPAEPGRSSTGGRGTLTAMQQRRPHPGKVGHRASEHREDSWMEPLPPSRPHRGVDHRIGPPEDHQLRP